MNIAQSIIIFTTLSIASLTAFGNNSKCGYEAPQDSFIRKNKSIRLGAYFYSGKLDQKWYSKNFDLLDLNAKNDPELVKNLKNLNPDIIIYQQFLTNQIALKKTGAQAVEGYDASKMNSWLLRDSNDLVARSHRGPYYLMMDIAGSQGWAAHFSNYVADVLRNTGADGIVLDEVPLFKNEPFTDLAAYPTPDKLQEGTRSFLRQIRSELSRPVLINAGQLHKLRSDGTPLWTWLGNDIDGAWHEGWIRYYAAHNDPHSGSDWEWDIRSAEEFSAKGKPYIASAAFRNSDELEYGIANYLLAINSKSLVFQPMVEYNAVNRGGFNSELVQQTVEKYRNFFDLEMGCALGPRQFTNGAWQRVFTNGLVSVNPKSSPVILKVKNGRYTDTLGVPVISPLQIPPFGARILLNTNN